MKTPMIAAIMLTFAAVQGLLMEDLKISKKSTSLVDKADVDVLPQVEDLPLAKEQTSFPQWALRQKAKTNLKGHNDTKHTHPPKKKIVKKRVTAPPTPPPTKAPVPPTIETMSAQWMEYHAANPTAASLRNAVREIICSMYDTEWCTNGEDYWAEVDAAAKASLAQVENIEDGKPHPSIFQARELLHWKRGSSHTEPHTDKLDEKMRAIIEKEKQKQDQKLDKWRARQQLKREKQEAREQTKDARRAAQQQLKTDMKQEQQAIKQEQMNEKAAMQQSKNEVKKDETKIPELDFEFSDDDDGLI